MNEQAISRWQSKIQQSRATLLNQLLLIAVIGGLAALILNYFSLPADASLQEQWWQMAPFLAGWLIVLVAWLWRGLGYRVRAWLPLILVFLLALLTFRRGGLHGSGRVWILLLSPLAFILLGPRAGVQTAALSIVTYFVVAIIFTQTPIELMEQQDPRLLTAWGGEGASFLLVVAILTLFLRSFSGSWLEALGEADAVNKQLRAQKQELEVTTEQLHKQTSQLQTTTEIARAGSSILDPAALHSTIVNQVQEGFSALGVYYVGLFLLDDAEADSGETSAVLKAATGEAGKLLLEMEHKLELDGSTTIGKCIIQQQACIAQNMEEGAAQLDALPMPNTRSEIALPLRSRGRILGALSVQSTHKEAFTKSDRTVLETLADQVAVAIDNARLFSQIEMALDEVETVHQRYLAQAWREFLTIKPVAKVDHTQPGVEPGDEEFLREARRAAMVHERTIATSGSASESDEEASEAQAALVTPLKLRGQIIGTLAVHETRQSRPWTSDEIALAENIAEQVSLTIENLRLMDETQRRAARERLVGEISSQVQRASDMESLMRVATEELNQALGGSRAYMHLSKEIDSTTGG